MATYLNHSVTIDFLNDQLSSSSQDLEKIIKDIFENPFDYTTETEQKEVLKSLFTIFRFLSSCVDDINMEFYDLSKEKNSLETEVEDLEETLRKKSIKIIEPETMMEKDIFQLCLDVYSNNSRLTQGDIDILKVLANKTLY